MTGDHRPGQGGRPRRHRPLLAVAAVAALGAGLLAGCGSGSGSAGSDAQLVLYNGQHKTTTSALVAGFTKRTGIKVEVRSGEDPELANQIVAEGSASPADVFYTENSPAMQLLAEKGKLATLPESVLSEVPSQYNSPVGKYVGIAARATVLLYNPAKISADELPASAMDLADPTWKGKYGIAPSGGDFQTIASAVLALKGQQAAEAWYKGLAENGRKYQNNLAILNAVNRGEVPMGLTYHYYWFRDQAESGDSSKNVKIHYFGNEDPGAFLSISAAGILADSKHKAAAEKFLAYLAGNEGQTELAKSNDFEYPLNKDVAANEKLRPLKELQAPTVDLSKVGDSKEAVRLMQDANLI